MSLGRKRRQRENSQKGPDSPRGRIIPGWMAVKVVHNGALLFEEGRIVETSRQGDPEQGGWWWFKAKELPGLNRES